VLFYLEHTVWFTQLYFKLSSTNKFLSYCITYIFVT